MFSSLWGVFIVFLVSVAAFFSWKNSQSIKAMREEVRDLRFYVRRMASRPPPDEQPEVKQTKTSAPPTPPENPWEQDAEMDESPIKQNNAKQAEPEKTSTKKPDEVTPLSVSSIVAELKNQTENKKSEPNFTTKKPDQPKTDSKSKGAWAHKHADVSQPTKPSTAKITAKTPPQPAPKPENIWKKYSNLEFDLGAKLPVWLGSIALIVAGFFFVKYSVENNLVPPYMRLIILFILGLGMVGGAEFVRKRPKFANGRRISQALVGVGLAVIYGVLYAASQIWQYIPVPVAMVGMVLTTLATLYMSIRYGIGVAYLALITAYLTPILMNVKESSTLFLFAYILGIFAATAFVAKRQKWWNILLVMLVANFAWVGYWFYMVTNPNEAIWVNIFLVAQSAVIIWSTRLLLGQKPASESIKDTSPEIVQKPKSDQWLQSRKFAGWVMNLIAHIGGLLFMAHIMLFADFSIADWAIFNVVMLASIGLAKYDEENYIYLPFASAILGGFMFIGWHSQSASVWALSGQMLFASTLLAGFGFYQIFKSHYARLWAFLSSLTALGYFIIYYLHLGSDLVPWMALETQLSSGSMAVIALVLAALFTAAYMKIRQQTKIVSHNNILANFAATATAFLALAIAIFVDRSIWPIAFGIQMVALSYIDSQLKNKIIRTLTIIMAVFIMGLLLPNLLDILDYMLELTFGIGILPNSAWDVEFLTSPLLYMGVPTICFAASAFFMRKHLDDITVKIMETIALTLVTLTGYLLIRYLFNGPAHIYDFAQSVAERGTITSFIFVMGLISFWLAKYTGRAGYITRGWVNIAIGFGRIVVFDLIMNNPLLELITLGGVTIFNPLIFAYALPIIWVFAVEYLLPKKAFALQIKYLKIATSLLLFAYINLNIRFAFQDFIVYWSDTSVAELYAYSIVWLLFGILLLVVAIWKQQKILRYASQAVIMLTVTKVFLYDAANLEGLYRIASFAVLGVCLIGISSIYSKYILIEGDEQEKDVEPDAESTTSEVDKSGD